MKRPSDTSLEDRYFKRPRPASSTYSSDSETEAEEPQGFVSKLSFYIKRNIVDSYLYQRVADMFTTRVGQRIASQNDSPADANDDEASDGVIPIDQLAPNNGKFRGRVKTKPLILSAGSSELQRFNSQNGTHDSDSDVLPIPVIKCKKSPKKMFKSSLFNSSVNGFSTKNKSGLLKRKIGCRSHDPFRKYELTAKESIRLAERDQYKRLLQQYTSTPVSSSASSLQSSRSNSSVSLCESIKVTFDRNESSRRDSSILSKSKLDMSDSKLLSLRLHSLANKYKTSTPFAGANSSVIKSPPIMIDLEDSASSPPQPVLDFQIKQSQSPEPTKIKHASITNPSQSVLSDKIKKYPFFSQEWTQKLKKELEEVSSELKPLIEIAQLETKSYQKKRDEKGLLFKEVLQKQLRQAKYSFHEIEAEKEEEEEEKFVELTDEMEAKIEEALVPTPPDQLLVEAFNLTIRRRDIETLSKLNWLNDEIINFYLNMLVDRGKNDNYPSVYAFNTFFYPKLMSSGHPALKRWTRKVDIFSYDFIVIPIHLGMHWCLAVISFKNKEVSYYDSLLNNNHDCLKALKQYLCDESLDKKKRPFDASDWALITPKEIPQQMNGSDCGMFACIYAEYITREAKITFTQEDMPYFRRRMVYEILTKQLL